MKADNIIAVLAEYGLPEHWLLEHELAEYELAEYIYFLIEYIEALLNGYAVKDDARFALNERYFPDHPVMRTVQAILSYE
jgi:hypothetical protein